MARDKRRGGRTTPKGTRPAHLRPLGFDDRGAGRSPIDEIVDQGGQELLAEDDAVAAETWASTMLDVFDGAARQARMDGTEVPPFVVDLLERCRQRRDRRALAVAAAFAAVVPPAHRLLAASVVADLQRLVVPCPRWVSTIGHATPTRAWVASDVFGDQESLIVGFHQEGDAVDHALVVLVDHLLSGQAKDAWIGADLHDVVATWSSHVDPHMWIEEIPVDQMLPRLRDAMAMSDVWNGDTELRSEDFTRHRALVWSRLVRAGVDPERTTDPEVTDAERDSLVAEFLASGEGRGVAAQLPAADVELIAHHLVGLRSDYEGRPLRWSPDVVSMVLTYYGPRKLLLDAGQAAALPEVLRSFVRFSAERTGLDPVFVAEILAAIDEHEAAFLDLMGDPGTAGPAKQVLVMLQAQEVDFNDLDEVNDALAKLGPVRLPAASPKRKRTIATPPAGVVTSAEGAPVLARFETLTRFYGDGRKLTQTGQPTLADARELVVLLGTKDRLDETIGDRTFQTRSAAELPELGWMIRWALSAGALRKEHGKLRATQAWAKLESRPFERWVKAADVLAKLGPLGGYHAEHRHRLGHEFVDELFDEILEMLESGPVAFDDALDWICEIATAGYEWLTPYMQDPDGRRRTFGWDLDLLTRILGWAGMAERVGAAVEPDRWGGERLVGGTLQLTPAGRWWLADVSK